MPRLFLLMIGLISLLFRVLLLWLYPFDGLYGQDAYFYLTATQDLARIWTDPVKLWQWLTVWGTPPVSVWPLGYHLQMTLMSLLTGLNAASGQLVSLITGSLTPVLTSMLFVEMWRLFQGEEIGCGNRTSSSPYSLTLPPSVLFGAALAGLIMSVSALAVRASLVVMADMAGLFWAVLGVLLAVRYLNDPRTKLAVGLSSGLCLGLASITRYIYPLLLLPILLVGSRVRDEGIELLPHPSPYSLIRRFLPIAAPVALFVGLQLAHNWAHPTASLPSPVLSTWNPANAWQSTFDSPDGHLSYQRPMVYFFLLRPLVSPDALGLWLLPLLMIGGFWIIVQSRRSKVQSPKTFQHSNIPTFQRSNALRPSLARAGLLAGWWLLFAGFYSGSVYQTDRFILSYLPSLAIISSLGLTRILDFGLNWSGPKSKIQNPKFVHVLIFCLVAVGLLFSTQTAVADFSHIYSDKEDFLRATHCLESAVGVTFPHKPIFSFAITFTLSHYTNLAPRELFFETPASVDQALARNFGFWILDFGSSPFAIPKSKIQNPKSDIVRGYLILPLSGFEEQWGKTKMGETYHHLKDKYTLTEISCPNTSFSLFEVRR